MMDKEKNHDAFEEISMNFQAFLDSKKINKTASF